MRSHSYAVHARNLLTGREPVDSGPDLLDDTRERGTKYLSSRSANTESQPRGHRETVGKARCANAVITSGDRDSLNANEELIRLDAGLRAIFDDRYLGCPVSLHDNCLHGFSIRTAVRFCTIAYLTYV